MASPGANTHSDNTDSPHVFAPWPPDVLAPWPHLEQIHTVTTQTVMSLLHGLTWSKYIQTTQPDVLAPWPQMSLHLDTVPMSLLHGLTCDKHRPMASPGANTHSDNTDNPDVLAPWPHLEQTHTVITQTVPMSLLHVQTHTVPPTGT